MLWRPEPLIQKSEQRWSSLPGCVIYMLSNKEPLSLLLTYLFAAKTEAKPRKLGEVSYENIFSLVLFLRPWPNSPSSFPYLTVLTQSRLWSEEQVSPATSQVGSCLKATDRCWNDQGNKWLYLVFCKILLKLELNHTTLLNDLSQLVLMCNQRYGWQELPSALQGQILHAEMVFCPSQLHGLWLSFIEAVQNWFSPLPANILCLLRTYLRTADLLLNKKSSSNYSQNVLEFLSVNPSHCPSDFLESLHL